MKRSRLRRGKGFHPAPHIEPLNEPCGLCGMWLTQPDPPHHIVPKSAIRKHCATLGWDPEPWLIDPSDSGPCGPQPKGYRTI